MKIGYGNGKIIWGREYDCSDDVDMKILIENLKAKFSKINDLYLENKQLKDLIIHLGCTIKYDGYRHIVWS